MVCHFLVPRLWLLLWPPQSEEFAESNPQISPLNSNIYQYDSSFSLIMGSLPQLAPLGILPVILVLREDLDTLFFSAAFLIDSLLNWTSATAALFAASVEDFGTQNSIKFTL